MLSPIKNTYKRIRKSLIKNKIFKMNEQINSFAKEEKLPCPEADKIERRKRELIIEYNKFDN